MITLTPKEKAKELVNKFLRTYKVSLYPPFTKASDEAKECALIAVNVILIDCGAKDWSGDEACEGKNYWQEVKQEIEKL
jgi:hypothetical protein